MSDASGYQRFFAELKRRKVFRVMAVYGAVGFVLLQIVELLVPALLLPEWTFRFVALLLLVGFPVAVILAWAFEMTPAGIQRTEGAEAGELTQIVNAPARQRIPIGLTAAIATGLFVGAVWMGLRSTGADTLPADATAPAQPAAQTTASGAYTAEYSPQAIAVLPFADLTGTDESRAFALGLQDDLMTQLTQVPDLKVTSRTSVMGYADETRPVSEIAQELGVGSIVEGGVRTSGGRVRLNVQLIDPATDEHLWAQTYDEELTAETVFEIQGEIARAVANALQAELSDADAEAIGAVLTDNIDAWNAYHQGKSLEDWSNDPEMERRTAEVLSLAVELDPGFVVAWARLVRAQAWLLRRGLETDTVPARRSLDRVIELDPESAARYYAEGIYQYYAQADYPSALEALQEGLAVKPNDSELLQFTGWVLRRMDRWDEGVPLLARAFELDPRNATLSWNQGLNSYRLRQYGLGRRQFEQGLALDPGSRVAGAFLAQWQLFTEGDTAAARATIERDVGFEAEGQRTAAEYWLAYLERDYERALEAAQRMTGEPAGIVNSATGQRSHSRPMRISLAYRMLGDEAAAHAWADSAVQLAETELATRPKPDPRDKFGVNAVARSSLAVSLAMRGDPGDHEEAVRQAEEAIRLHGYQVDSGDSDYMDWSLLRTYVLVGRPDDAIAFFAETQTRQASGLGLGDLKLDPLYDELRDDPRWQALIDRAEEQAEW